MMKHNNHHNELYGMYPKKHVSSPTRGLIKIILFNYVEIIRCTCRFIEESFNFRENGNLY